METGRLRFATNQQAMGFARAADCEDQHAIAGLVNLLNASVKQHGRNFAKHTLDVDCAHCHVAGLPKRSAESMKAAAIVTQGLRGDSPRLPAIVQLSCGSYNREEFSTHRIVNHVTRFSMCESIRYVSGMAER